MFFTIASFGAQCCATNLYYLTNYAAKFSTKYAENRASLRPEILDQRLWFLPSRFYSPLSCRSAESYKYSLMSFKIDPLDENINFDDAKSSPKWIVGAGQMVYWRSCFIKVYASTNPKETTHQFARCDGQGTVPKGTEIYFGGRGGQILP